MIDHLQPYHGKQALSIHESSHDTFDADKHLNWLCNEAGQGIYVHGRVHQEVGYSIFVGDMIHKRGHLMTDDLLKMEEQNLLSMGEPLSVPTRLGSLQAMAILPTMNTANGEGSLVAYYEHGVVAFDTFEIPRETRHDEEGVVIQKGWDTKRLVNHLLNAVSAVGRYAVTTLTRDHLFRSKRGLHFLKTTLGEGSFNTEQTNRISSDVDPLLAMDSPVDLSGAATGWWMDGDRMFASTGMVRDVALSSDAYGRGFVVWNQALTFTDNRTPIAIWEGMWTFDYGIAGMHKFTNDGFICSSREDGLYHGIIDKTLKVDTRDEEDIPIEWSFETGAYALAGTDSRMSINGCTIEMLVSDLTRMIRVYLRTDSAGVWELWASFKPNEKITVPGEQLLFNQTIGKHSNCNYRDATWAEIRVEGIGYMELRLITLDFSPSTVKSGRTQDRLVSRVDKDFFEINTTPVEDRWPAA